MQNPSIKVGGLQRVRVLGVRVESGLATITRTQDRASVEIHLWTGVHPPPHPRAAVHADHVIPDLWGSVLLISVAADLLSRALRMVPRQRQGNPKRPIHMLWVQRRNGIPHVPLIPWLPTACISNTPADYAHRRSPSSQPHSSEPFLPPLYVFVGSRRWISTPVSHRPEPR